MSTALSKLPRVSVMICLKLIAYTFSFSQNLVHTVYTSEEGLPSSNVYCVEQDSSGYIWAITNYGVTRYNGETFTTFDRNNGFPDRGGFHLYKDSRDVLWFIPFNGRVCYFNGQTFNVPAFFDEKKFGPVSWLTEDSQGNICFSTRTGKLIIYSRNGQVNCINVSEHFIICFIEISPSIYLLQDSYELKWINIKTNETGVVKNFYNNYEKNFYPRLKRLKDGRILHTTSEGIFEVTAGFKLKKLVSKSELGINNELYNIYEDADKNIWIPTRMGLMKFNQELEVTKAITYFKNYTVLTVIKDSEDNMWMATAQGLIKILSEGACFYSMPDGMASSHILQLCTLSQNGVLAINYEGDVYSLKNNKIRHEISGLSTVISDARVFKRIAGDEYFVGTINKSLSFNIKTKKIILLNAFDIDIHHLLHDNDTSFFIDFIGVGYLSNGSKVYHYKGRHEAFTGIYNGYCARDRTGNFWIGNKAGLVKVSSGGKLVEMVNEHAVCGMSVAQIQVTSQGRVWVATSLNTIYCINNNGIITYQLPTPPNTRIRNLALHNDTVLWVATNNGAYKLLITKNNLLKPVYHYTAHNALLSNDVSSIIQSGDNVYFATNKGISVINEQVYKLKKLQPPVIINHLFIGNINAAASLMCSISVDYKNNFLAVEAESPIYSRGKINYQYMLEPLDTAWENSVSNVIKYSSLPPGNYTFRIKAADLFGYENRYEKRFTFSIKKPYWLTLWFWALVLMAAAGILYSVIKRRLAKIRREAALQKGLVEAQLKALRLQMNPHFIFNSLQSIQDYIIAHQNKLAVNYLSKFSKLVRKALDYSKKDFIPLSEDLEMLDLYVELEKARFDGKLEFIKTIDTDLDLESVFIPPMLIQPFIENSVKHGIGPRGEGKIHLTIKISGGFLYTEITDNGIGRDATAKAGALKTGHLSTGINHTTERLNMIFSNYGMTGATIEINNLYENQVPAGTQVIIKIPYGSK